MDRHIGCIGDRDLGQLRTIAVEQEDLQAFSTLFIGGPVSRPTSNLLRNSSMPALSPVKNLGAMMVVYEQEQVNKVVESACPSIVTDFQLRDAARVSATHSSHPPHPTILLVSSPSNPGHGIFSMILLSQRHIPKAPKFW